MQNEHILALLFLLDFTIKLSAFMERAQNAREFWACVLVPFGWVILFFNRILN